MKGANRSERCSEACCVLSVPLAKTVTEYSLNIGPVEARERLTIPAGRVILCAPLTVSCYDLSLVVGGHAMLPGAISPDPIFNREEFQVYRGRRRRGHEIAQDFVFAIMVAK